MSRLRVAALAIAVGLVLAGCGAGSGKPSKSVAGAGPASSVENVGKSNPAVGSSGIATTTATSMPRPFAAGSPWNTRVDQLPADPSSSRLISLAQQRQDVEYTGSLTPHVVTRTITAGLFINTTRWTDTIVEAGEGVPTSVICRQQMTYCGEGAGVSTLNIPVGVSPKPQFDGWFTVLDRSADTAYDLWRARRGANGRVISYQYMRKWSLTGPGYSPPGVASARGSGLPLFAGVITPQDIQAGTIEHALAISLPGPARGTYVQPASTTDGVGAQASLPEGARIRLRADVRLGRISTGTDARAARAIVRALKLYGAIVVDRARVPTLYAQLNSDWQSPLKNGAGKLIYGDGRELPAALQGIEGQGVPLLRGNEVQSLHLRDFEVVSLPPRLSYPPPGTPAVPATPATEE
ncbi:MAG TPA: hypothetical protein VMV16_05085 [Solirubrobacteraceae bacterium]|nr:hypothetical protein [Solirubrobacteraceae bacterium]